MKTIVTEMKDTFDGSWLVLVGDRVREFKMSIEIMWTEAEREKGGSRSKAFGTISNCLSYVKLESQYKREKWGRRNIWRNNENFPKITTDPN